MRNHLSLGVLGALALLAGCQTMSPQQQANEPLPPGAAHVEMGLRSFSPKNLTIRRGETARDSFAASVVRFSPNISTSSSIR